MKISKTLFSSNKLFEVIGLPGSGKTTLAKKISSISNLKYIDIDLYLDNPFLSLFSSNPQKYAFITGVKFSYDRSKQISKVKSLLQKQSVILDQGFDSGFYIYSKNHLVQGRILKNEFEFMQTLHNSFMRNKPKVHTSVVIQLPISHIIERIIKRGRSIEKQYNINYLLQLNSCYLDYQKNLINSNMRKGLILYYGTNKIKRVGKPDIKLLSMIKYLL